MISNSTELVQGIKEAINIIDNDDGLSLRHQLNLLKNSLSFLSKLDEKMQEKLNLIDSISIDLIELEKDLGHHLHIIDINDNDKNLIENKIKNTFDFLRKYHVSADQLEEQHETWQKRIIFLRSLTNESTLESSLNDAKSKFDAAAKVLSE